MKLIDSSVTLMKQGNTQDAMFKHIELAGRTCYKSEDKITDTSAKEFVERLKKSKHLSVLEHGTVYMITNIEDVYMRYNANRYSRTRVVIDSTTGKRSYYITTNYRVIVEHGWEDDLKYVVEPDDYLHEKRITIKFVCDRGVSHELVRHRSLSFSQESTRYIAYDKAKFGKELTFIKPTWDYAKYPEFEEFLKNAEDTYMKLRESGAKAQEARAVLPNAIKTEVVVTGYIDEWECFLALRCAENAHPDIRKLALEVKQIIESYGHVD